MYTHNWTTDTCPLFESKLGEADSLFKVIFKSANKRLYQLISRSIIWSIKFLTPLYEIRSNYITKNNHYKALVEVIREMSRLSDVLNGNWQNNVWIFSSYLHNWNWISWFFLSLYMVKLFFAFRVHVTLVVHSQKTNPKMFFWPLTLLLGPFWSILVKKKILVTYSWNYVTCAYCFLQNVS